MVLLLSRNTLETIYGMKDAISALEEAFRQVGRKKVISPKRPVVNIKKHSGTAILNIGYITTNDSLAVKIATSFPNNFGLNAPTVNALIVLIDGRTGIPISIMDGNYLTELKTGAAGAVAAKYLAPSNTRVVGVIGTGVQARAQLLGIQTIFKIDYAIAFSRNPKNLELFKAYMEDTHGLQVKVAKSPDEVVGESDVVITATTSTKPVFDGKKLKIGCHINAIGSFTPEAREIDDSTIERAHKVFVDNWEALNVGDLRFPIKSGKLSRRSILHLSEVVTGRIRGRETDSQITLFKSVGGAPYDTAVAKNCYEIALSRKVGFEFNFS